MSTPIKALVLAGPTHALSEALFKEARDQMERKAPLQNIANIEFAGKTTEGYIAVGGQSVDLASVNLVAFEFIGQVG